MRKLSRCQLDRPGSNRDREMSIMWLLWNNGSRYLYDGYQEIDHVSSTQSGQTCLVFIQHLISGCCVDYFVYLRYLYTSGYFYLVYFFSICFKFLSQLTCLFICFLYNCVPFCLRVLFTNVAREDRGCFSQQKQHALSLLIRLKYYV